MATILSSKKSAVGSPYVYYTVDVTTSNRTTNGITLKMSVTAWLGSSSSQLGTGSTYGILGYLKILGTEYAITIKGTDDSWSGTTKHTATITKTISGLNASDTSITGVKFRTTRTGSKNDGSIAHAGELGSTSCSNITFEAGHTPPSDVTYSMIEARQKLVDAGVPDNVIVENLSLKRFTIGATLYDNASVKYAIVYNRINFIRVETTDNPATVDFDFSTEELSFNDDGTKTLFATQITDSFGSAMLNKNTTSMIEAWDEYDYIPYRKISLIETSTAVKRNGQTSGKVNLNVNGTFYNGVVGNVNQSGTYKPVIKYNFWKLGDAEPTTYDYSVPEENIVVNGTQFKVENYEIGSSVETDSNYFNPDYAYRVKVYVKDNFTTYPSQEKPIAVGEATWTEYKDRVDFKRATKKGNDFYAPQIGDVIITSTNVGAEEMAKRHGGKWTLVDKEFKNVYEFLSNTNVATLTSLSNLDVRLFRTGHMVYLDVSATTKANITDTTLNVCTLNVEALGFQGKLGNRTMYITGFSDGGNNMIQFSMSTGNFVIQSLDAVGDDSHKVSSGATIYWNQTIIADSFNSMLDEDCDKFYWRKDE